MKLVHLRDFAKYTVVHIFFLGTCKRKELALDLIKQLGLARALPRNSNDRFFEH